MYYLFCKLYLDVNSASAIVFEAKNKEELLNTILKDFLVKKVPLAQDEGLVRFYLDVFFDKVRNIYSGIEVNLSNEDTLFIRNGNILERFKNVDSEFLLNNLTPKFECESKEEMDSHVEFLKKVFYDNKKCGDEYLELEVEYAL
jgi:hypothetical protein